MKSNFTAALSDCQAADALEPAIAAREDAAKLGDLVRALKEIGPEDRAFLFQNDAQYYAILARAGFLSGAAISHVARLEIAAGAINPQQVGKPIAAGTSVRYQGD